MAESIDVTITKFKQFLMRYHALALYEQSLSQFSVTATSESDIFYRAEPYIWIGGAFGWMTSEAQLGLPGGFWSNLSAKWQRFLRGQPEHSDVEAILIEIKQ